MFTIPMRKSDIRLITYVVHTIDFLIPCYGRVIRNIFEAINYFTIYRFI